MDRKARIELDLNCGNCPLQKDERDKFEALILNHLQHEFNKMGIVIEATRIWIEK